MDFLRDFNCIHVDYWLFAEVETPFQVKPHQFLRFAEYDLNSNYEHHLVNSLSNIKRAIECQLDTLLFGFGLYGSVKKKRLSFPKKVALLDSLGVVSPRILKRINKKRNLLEHQYIQPETIDVEDALDVATLFIAYTDKFLSNRALGSCRLFHLKGDGFDFSLEYKQEKIILSDIVEKDEKRVDKRIGVRKEVNANDAEYCDYLKLFLSLYKIL
jgi:hypothetical protein